MRIKKVKFDGSRVEILYEKQKPAGIDEFSLKCTDMPAPAFIVALEGLRPSVALLCEMPKEWGENLKIRGVSFSWQGDNEVMGATISALKPLENFNCPLVINTPHAVEEAPCPTAEANLLPLNAIKTLKTLLDETKKYILGERETQALPNMEKPESPAGPLKIKIDLNKKCLQCGQKGQTNETGYCLTCIAKGIKKGGKNAKGNN